MSERITQALIKLFDRHRIVFWYDAKQELYTDFESFSLTEVKKLEIANNEFGIKFCVLREQPLQKFLLYHKGPQPEDIDNWLLDIQLAHGEFRTDQVAIWLSELELGIEFSNIVQAHQPFFQDSKRKDSFKAKIKPEDTEPKLRMKMLAVCAGSDDEIRDVMKCLLDEYASGREEKIKLIHRCNFTAFLWEQIARVFNYQPTEPSIKDFAIELFKSCYAMATESDVKLNSDALVFLKNWKDSRQFEDSFEKISGECERVLKIEDDLFKRDFRKLMEIDYFSTIDQKIISELIRGVSARVFSYSEVSHWVRRRRKGHWYLKKYNNLYESIDYASQFMKAISEVKLEMATIEEGVKKYCSNWYLLDQLYRKFTYHNLKAEQTSLLKPLADQIENLYSNNFLMKLGDRFQEIVNTAVKWPGTQNRFYGDKVQYILKNKPKVCVIISDAMRYEIGQELQGLIQQENRFTAELESAISVVPSYTQLGMAALLPHNELAIAENDTGTVLIDGQSSQGTENRSKILKAALNGRGQAIQATDFLNLTRDESREIFKANEVLYVYHNRIDHIGDKKHSEGQTFEAVEETLKDIISILKKLVNANASNFIVTADHGFIYQHKEIAESDFLSVDAEGKKILYKNRRFVFGHGLNESRSLLKLTAKQLGLKGDLEVQIPKSINRLRLQGSGSRFVHGGTTLQEIVIPILTINKKRKDDINFVEVEILRGGNTVITAGQLAVTLYQVEPISEKIQSRKLRAGIYTNAGELISDSHTLTFDIKSESPRDREIQVQFLLTRKSDAVNGQEVTLKLEEEYEGTMQFTEYKAIRYMMRRSFTSDFDL